jgi:FkbM family methyltransferase
MIDAGGCTGQVSKICAEKIASLKEITVIEASKKNSKFIEDNLKSLGVKVTVLNNALYYGQEYVNIGLADGDSNVGGYSVNLSDLVIENSVKTITLESILNDKTVDFLKIDIEGAEQNVIENSSKIKEIKFIDIEFHDDLRTNWKPVIENYFSDYTLVYEFADHAFLEKK